MHLPGCTRQPPEQQPRNTAPDKHRTCIVCNRLWPNTSTRKLVRVVVLYFLAENRSHFAKTICTGCYYVVPVAVIRTPSAPDLLNFYLPRSMDIHRATDHLTLLCLLFLFLANYRLASRWGPRRLLRSTPTHPDVAFNEMASFSKHCWYSI